METVYRIAHNIEKCLKFGETESKRYFSDLKYANAIFEMIASHIDYSNDEWIALDEVSVSCSLGEYKSDKEVMLRYLSDDTNIGVNFDPIEYLRTKDESTTK